MPAAGETSSRRPREPGGGEQVREHPGHRASVLHHVGDARRRAQVVLEHTEGPVRVADQVDARDVDAHTVGRVDAGRLTVEVLARCDEPTRDQPVAQDLLLAVDVVEVVLQRLHPLRDAALEPRPFRRGDDARNEVERKRPLLTRQRERDPLIDECATERLCAGRQIGGVRRRQLGVDALVRGADGPAVVEHLIEGRRIRAAFRSPRRCPRTSSPTARRAPLPAFPWVVTVRTLTSICCTTFLFAQATTPHGGRHFGVSYPVAGTLNSRCPWPGRRSINPVLSEKYEGTHAWPTSSRRKSASSPTSAAGCATSR